MTAEWWIDLVLVLLIAIVVAQNMGIKERLRDLEAKLDRRPI